MVSQNRHQICQAGYFFSRLCLPGRYRYFVDLALIPHFFKQGLVNMLLFCWIAIEYRPRLIWERANDVQGHIDLRVIFRATAFQGIAQ